MSMALEMQNCFKTKGGRRMFLFRLPLSSSTPSLALYKACFELRHYPLLRPLCGVNDSIPLFGAPKTDWGNLGFSGAAAKAAERLIGGASDRYVLWDVKAA